MLEVAANENAAVEPAGSPWDIATVTPAASPWQTEAITPEWSFGRAGASERFEIESFVRNGFESAYGCRLAQFMPELMVLRHKSKIAAVCGLRPALAGKLFLEIYLDHPVESVLGDAASVSLARSDITEVGNLVIARPGYARRLIVQLTEYLYSRGRGWVVFSAVPALRNNFLRAGIPLVTLAPADARRLSADERASWGNYYDHLPLVTAVSVASAYNAVCTPACTR
jgi:hypothetical protein